MTSSRAALAALAALGLPLVAGGCLFLPNIEQHGYVSCTSNKDCDPGRSCGEGVCAPPPWNDETFGARRALLVKNETDVAMSKGTAVPVVIGEGGLLAIEDIGNDFRFTDFDVEKGAWSELAVYLDKESDRLTAWIPTQRDIPQGKTDVLAYIEFETFDKAIVVKEDPVSTFRLFDAFDGDALDEDKWNVIATGGAPVVDGGLVNIQDNQNITLKQPLAPPVRVDFVARVNAANCDRVFFGFTGDDDARFLVGPGAGLFLDQDLDGDAQVAVTPQSPPAPLDSVRFTTSLTRYSVAIDDNGARMTIDGEVVAEELDLRPPFDEGSVFATVEVNGACSVDVDAVWVTPLPLPAPTVTAGPLVHFQLLD
jgi:hypothetical protein